MPHFGRLSGRLAALALLAGSLTGCQVIDGTPLYTQVRIIDASPDAPGLDIYQNSTAGLYDIALGTASSYISIGPGSYSYSADVTGTRQQLATVYGAFAAGAQYTVLVGNAAASLQMTLLKDQATPAPAGEVALRILDQSVRNGAVDIYLLPLGSKLSSVTPITTNMRFGNSPAYINAPAGTYSLVLLPAGTVATSSTVPLYTGAQVEYPSTGAHTIVLIDQLLVTIPGFQVISVDDYDSPLATS